MKQKGIKRCSTSTRKCLKINAAAALISIISNVDDILKIISIHFVSRTVPGKSNQQKLKNK